MKTHLDADDLALVAVGDGGEGQVEHVESCAQCRAEVESLEAVTAIMVDAGPMPSRGPDHVWDAIQDAVAAEASPVAPAPEPASQNDVAAGSSASDGDEPVALGPRRAQREQTRSKGRTSAFALLGAAAVGAGVMWVSLTVADQGSSPDAGPVVATAELDALEGDVSPATAEIIERDGERLLRVDTSSLPRVEDGYLQVWLLQDGAAGMVTVGALSYSGEEFVLPEGLSTDTFGIVDVSVEHYDGDPAHSGESLWRGPISSV
ncbi:MAG: anti-sigma factor [Ornithinimicrobium sp.]